MLRVLQTVFLALSLLFAVAGCQSLKEGLEDAQATSQDIEAQLGVKAQVNFHVTNGHKKVSVTLSETPEGEAKEIKAKVRTIVEAHFEDVDEVEIAM